VTTSAERAAKRTRAGRRPRGASGAAAEGEVRAPRTGAKRTLMGTIQQIPHYLRLLAGLLTDPRVPRLDKILVGAAIAYILLPTDFIPDFVPFLGEVDDVFLLVTALQRLISNAGRRVVLDHWGGDAEELADLNLRKVLTAATFFLPGRIRRRLKTIGR
jgi:uncharacterized membrane protein YkvA (DUF1232 family)